MNRSFSKISIVERVADDDRQLAVRLGQRDGEFSRATDSGTSSTIDGGIDDFVEIDVVQAVLLGHGPHHFFAGGISQPGQRIGHFHALLGGHLLGFSELVGADNALVDKDFGPVTDMLGGHVISGKVGADPYIYPG